MNYQNINTFSTRQYRNAVKKFTDKGCTTYINVMGGTEIYSHDVCIAIVWKNF